MRDGAIFTAFIWIALFAAVAVFAGHGLMIDDFHLLWELLSNR